MGQRRKGELPMLDMQDVSMGYILIVKHAYFLSWVHTLEAYLTKK